MKTKMPSPPIIHDGHKYQPFCHCPSVCPYKDGVFVTYYAGLHEAHASQHVRVTYWDGKQYLGELKMGSNTGNPVIWSIGDRAVLLFSRFEKETESAVAKWMYCSNWITVVSLSGKKIRHTTPKRLDIEVGHLGRCAPIKINDEWLLPLYREHDPYGLIMASKDGVDWKKRGIIGESDEDFATRFGKGILIQPTIWHDGEYLKSLSRDVSRQGFAWYSQSDDMGATWSTPSKSLIPNFNSSLVAVHDGSKLPYVIWNQDRSRQILLMSRHPYDSSTASQLNDGKKAAYPNYCFDNAGKLHVVHSDDNYTAITHHVFEDGLA